MLNKRESCTTLQTMKPVNTSLYLRKQKCFPHAECRNVRTATLVFIRQSRIESKLLNSRLCASQWGDNRNYCTWFHSTTIALRETINIFSSYLSGKQKCNISNTETFNLCFNTDTQSNTYHHPDVGTQMRQATHSHSIHTDTCNTRLNAQMKAETHQQTNVCCFKKEQLWWSTALP